MAFPKSPPRSCLSVQATDTPGTMRKPVRYVERVPRGPEILTAEYGSDVSFRAALRSRSPRSTPSGDVWEWTTLHSSSPVWLARRTLLHLFTALVVIGSGVLSSTTPMTAPANAQTIVPAPGPSFPIGAPGNSQGSSPSSGPPIPAAPESPLPPGPALTASGLWARTSRETGIWSGWDTAAVEFGKAPGNVQVQIIEQRGTRAYVFFPGDTRGHKAGEIWMDKADLTDLPWPRWVRARRPTVLRSDPDLSAEQVIVLARGSYVETTGETRGRWAQAFFLLDRQPAEWVTGWVDGLDLWTPRGDQNEITTYMLTRSAVMAGSPEVWLRVPYRSQIDGSPWADANCGPTSVGMALEALGLGETSDRLRSAVMDMQNMSGCDDCGSFITSLATIAELKGARAYSLRDEPDKFHAWTLDEVRRELRASRVVIPQVKYRLLPGRGNINYWGDHYIVITGISGNSFIYNDPVDSDGRGYGRVMTAENLERAMAGATGEYSRAAFSVGR